MFGLSASVRMVSLLSVTIIWCNISKGSSVNICSLSWKFCTKENSMHDSRVYKNSPRHIALLGYDMCTQYGYNITAPRRLIIGLLHRADALHANLISTTSGQLRNIWCTLHSMQDQRSEHRQQKFVVGLRGHYVPILSHFPNYGNSGYRF